MLLQHTRNLLTHLRVTLAPVANPDSPNLRAHTVSHECFRHTLHKTCLTSLVEATPASTSLHQQRQVSLQSRNQGTVAHTDKS
jgi:ABC-type thiamine transport system ATPase subunit